MIPVIHQARFEKLKALRWKNSYSRRLQQLTGDKLLYMAWDQGSKTDAPAPGAWVIGRLCDRMVKGAYFGRESQVHERVVIPFMIWSSAYLAPGPNMPLAPDHPQLPSYLQRIDGYRRRDALNDADAQADLREHWRQESRRREIAARARDAAPRLLKWADQYRGFIGREGAGGERKHFVTYKRSGDGYHDAVR